MFKLLAVSVLLLSIASCDSVDPLYHPDPDGSTVVQIDGQDQTVNHFPNKTYIKGTCYFLTKDNDPKSIPTINTEEPYNNGCAGG